MKQTFTLLLCLVSVVSLAIDPNHFTITRISAPYFIVDGNAPSTITKAYVGFEVRNTGSMTYTGLKFAVTSIGTSVVGQNYAVVSPAGGIINVGTLAPGASKVCYYYVSYPASVTPQATFNVALSNNTAGTKTQSITISNRSSISANAGGTATQSFTNQDLIGGIITDDVAYVVGNVQNGDENDFQISVASQFDPAKMTLLSTQVVSSSVPGIVANVTDSLYFLSGNAGNGATVTIRWTFRISGYDFTNYLLPCAGATSGNTNYKYALNTSLGSGTPVVISASANPLTITKSSDRNMYRTNATALFTITINNPGAYGITIDRIADELPAGFTFQSFDATSQVTATNSTTVPVTGATSAITFEGGVTSGPNTSYYVPAGGSLVVKYTATAPSQSALNLTTTVRDYVGTTQVGSAVNTVGVSATLPVTLLYFRGNAVTAGAQLSWATANEVNSRNFAIERSTNNSHFVSIGSINAAGVPGSTKVYSYLDSFFSGKTAYYRLKITDRDGQVTYSPVVSVGKQQAGMIVHAIQPNPFVNNLTVRINVEKELPVLIGITNISGQLVVRKSVRCRKGENSIILPEANVLMPGTYFFQVVSTEGSVQQKLVKIK